jgi:hypothetical protein
MTFDEFATAHFCGAATSPLAGERVTVIDGVTAMPSLEDGFPASYFLSPDTSTVDSPDHESVRQETQPSTAKPETSSAGLGIPDVVQLKPQAVSGKTRKAVLQQWEGTVREVRGGEFVADIFDLTNSSNPREEVVLPVDEVSPSDVPLLEPGAVFYWHISYETSQGGQRTRVSEIRFRRWPPWTRGELRVIEKEATALMEQLSQPDAQSACG